MRYLLLAPFLVTALAAETFLVAVGVETYDDASITPLRYAVADATALAAAFRLGGLPARNVALLTSSATDRRQLATKSNLLLALRAARGRARAADTLILFFAGHGQHLDGQTFLLAADTVLDQLGTTALSIRDLEDALAGLETRQVLLLIDACRNDPRTARATANATLNDSFARSMRPRLAAPPGSTAAAPALLFACGIGQRAWEMPDDGHGAFTYWLLQGLTEARAADGTVRLQALAAFVQREVPAWARRMGRDQTPHFDNPAGVDFELLRVPTTAATVPRTTVVEPTPVDQPVQLSLEGLAPTPSGWLCQLRPDQQFTELLGMVTGSPSPTVTANGQPVSLVPAGPGRWSFRLHVALEPGASSLVTVAARGTAAQEDEVVFRVRRPTVFGEPRLPPFAPGPVRPSAMAGQLQAIGDGQLAIRLAEHASGLPVSIVGELQRSTTILRLVRIPWGAPEGDRAVVCDTEPSAFGVCSYTPAEDEPSWLTDSILASISEVMRGLGPTPAETHLVSGTIASLAAARLLIWEDGGSQVFIAVAPTTGWWQACPIAIDAAAVGEYAVVVPSRAGRPAAEERPLPVWDCVLVCGRGYPAAMPD